MSEHTPLDWLVTALFLGSGGYLGWQAAKLVRRAWAAYLLADAIAKSDGPAFGPWVR